MSKKESDVVLNFKMDGQVQYAQTIKEINQVMNTAASEYKNHASAMRKDATETEKLTITKKKLEIQLEGASKRSQMLRDEYEKSVKETGAYSEQSKKLYKQLQDSETGENKLKTALDNTNSALKKQGDVSVDTAKKIQQIEKAGDKIKGVGEKVSLGVTAPIMAAGAASVKVYEDMRSSQAKLINQTGKTGAEAENLKKSLDNLYGSSAKDSDELAEALGTIVQRFDVSGKAAESMTSKFLTFARVNGVEAPNAIEKVSRAMGDAGIETEKYEEVLDLLTVAHQKSGIEVDKLTENLAKYGAPMRQLGFDTQESIAMFAGWEKAGVNTEIAFSGMKKAISTWGKESKKPMEEFPKALEKIQNSANPVADAIEIFGAKAGPDLADAIKEGRFSMEDMNEALADSKGKLQEIGDATANPMSKMKVAIHNVSLALIPFGEIIIETITPAIQAFAEFMKGVVEKLDKMDEGTRKTIITLGLVAASVGPVLVALGSMAGSITKVVKAVKLMQSAFAAVSAFLAANPFVLGIAAIALLVAAVVTAYKKVQWFHDGVNAFFRGISDVAVEVFNFMSGYIEGVFGGILVNLQNYLNAGKRLLGGLIDFVTGVFTGNWQQAWQGVQDIFGGIFDGMVALAKAPLNLIIGLVNGLIGGLNNISVPKWVPGIGGKGVNISTIPYLATGGHLINGQAIVGEAGPELLSAKNGKTTVTPLSDDEKRKGIGGSYPDRTVIEQHNHFGRIDANNPSEVARMNRQMKQAANQALVAKGGLP
ncbi:MAG: phage tail tape measure protein [Lactococcus garvieae]